jgi:acyl-CoA thioester hydrolase
MLSPEMKTTPLFTTENQVRPEWIDHNGHLNVAYYVLAFDQATDDVYEAWQIGLAYQDLGMSVFTLGLNVDYLGELFAGDAILITTQLLDWDHKRLHYVHRMFRRKTAQLVATNECLAMNVDLATRRSASFPESVQHVLARVLEQHSTVERPPQMGRTLAIRRPG